MQAVLHFIRSETGSQWSCCTRGVQFWWRGALRTRRAAEFWTFCIGWIIIVLIKRYSLTRVKFTVLMHIHNLKYRNVVIVCTLSLLIGEPNRTENKESVDLNLFSLQSSLQTIKRSLGGWTCEFVVDWNEVHMRNTHSPGRQYLKQKL